MAKLYKLTDKNGQTRGRTQWGAGVSHSGTGKGELCGPGWIHAYEHPLISVLLNPIHGDFGAPRLWEAEGEVALRDRQLKCGCRTLTTIREIALPEITAEMRVRFAILCAKKVCKDTAWNAWADKWLSGEDRSAAAAAAWAEAAAAWAEAAEAAAEAAAAWAWAEAAEAEARAAAEARAVTRAWAAARAEAARAEARAEAAASAATAAEWAEIDLFAIAEDACGVLA